MTLNVGDNKLPVYNEPSKDFTRDVVPQLREVSVGRLNEYVRARIELERRMLVCGVGPQAESLKFTTAHAAVLLVMLQEFDSPLAARLRTQAASWAGSFELKEAIPILRELILDEDDDLQTRLNAIPSLISG
jgi:hypothetical protein